MNKRLFVESNEKQKILDQHKKEMKVIKKIITEQSKNRSEAIKFFTDAKNSGCLTDANLDFTGVFKQPGENSVYIKGVSKTTGNTKRIFDDYTWKVVNSKGDVIKSGTWSCKKQEENVQDISTKLPEYKNQGYQEYKDVVLKTKIDDPKFYEIIAFKGVPTDKLYRPLYSVNEVGKIENWPADSEQRKVLEQLLKDGFIINPSQVDKMSGNLELYVPQIDASLFPNGLQVYRDKRKPQTSNVNVSKENIKSSTVGAQNCEEGVQTYWDSYKNNAPSEGTVFDNMKNIAQACANQNMYRWKDIGGVLGVGGGKRHLDNILEVMTNKRQEYEKVRMPGNGTPWALNAPRIQGRGR
jgi:hypothetical protein